MFLIYSVRKNWLLFTNIFILTEGLCSCDSDISSLLKQYKSVIPLTTTYNVKIRNKIL